ncbi:uncharacterized protein [Montipora capricornis]|uniref:uncharacterized protein n=1 Tax=Montipora capricornis TaxID=246305 RepID=UPI0035F1687F
MAGMLRRGSKTASLFMITQRHFVAKTDFIQDNKTENKNQRKEAKREERREIVKEITKGYFADLREFRKNGGKRFFALGRPSELKDSLPFPGLKARNLVKKEIDLQRVFCGHVTLLLLWFRGFGEAMCDKYRLPFVENFHSEQLAQCYEINVVDGLIFKPFSRWFEKNLRKQRPVERHDHFLCFDGNARPIKEKFLENTIVGHAFLVDCNGLVRWKAHANPTDEELKFMLDCSKLLLKDTYRTLGKNNNRSSNYR